MHKSHQQLSKTDKTISFLPWLYFQDQLKNCLTGPRPGWYVGASDRQIDGSAKTNRMCKRTIDELLKIDLKKW